MSREVKHKRVSRDYSLVSNFRHLSDSVVYYVQNNRNVYYNIDENIVFNSCFSKIENFNELGYALARIDITSNDKQYYVFGYINELGELVSPLVNTYDFVMENVLDLNMYLTSLTQRLENSDNIKLTKNLLD